MVVCRDEKLADRMALIRSHGMSARGSYWHEVSGSNFRMTNMQAALGVARMECSDSVIGERKGLLATYRELMGGMGNIAIQAFRAPVDPVVWTLGVRLLGDNSGPRRGAVMARFEEAGIEVRPGFHCASEMPAIRDFSVVRTGLPRSRQLAESVLALPFYPGLRKGEVEEIASLMSLA